MSKYIIAITARKRRGAVVEVERAEYVEDPRYLVMTADVARARRYVKYGAAENFLSKHINLVGNIVKVAS